MAQTGGFDQQAIGFAWRSRVFSPTCIGRPLTQHHAAAGDLFEQGAAIGQQRAVYPDFAKLVNQYGPFFIRRLLRQQMKNRGRLTAAEKAGDQIGSGHSFLGINVML